MQCARCERDFREDEKEKGFYTQQNDHFLRPFRQSGYVCPHCGFHNMIFHVAVPVPFIRTNATYDKLDLIVEEFKTKVESFYRERSKSKNPNLFDDEDTQSN